MRHFRRFMFQHIQACASQAAFRQCFFKCYLVHHGTSCGVNQNRAALHERKSVGVNQVMRFMGKRHMKRNDVHLRKQIRERPQTNTGSLSVSPYVKSRALAERAAWEFAEREGGGMELAVVNPVGIFGPVLGPDLSGSVGIVRAMLDGSLPRTPRLWTSVVDVRDVADLLLRAMTSPKAAGERFLAAAGDAISFQGIARILRDRLGPDEAARVPDRDISNWFVRAASPFVPPLRQFRRNLGVIRHTDAAKAHAVLDWAPRSPEDAVVATARSLLDLGLAGVGGPPAATGAAQRPAR